MPIFSHRQGDNEILPCLKLILKIRLRFNRFISAAFNDIDSGL